MLNVIKSSYFDGYWPNRASHSVESTAGNALFSALLCLSLLFSTAQNCSPDSLLHCLNLNHFSWFVPLTSMQHAFNKFICIIFIHRQLFITVIAYLLFVFISRILRATATRHTPAVHGARQLYSTT